MKEGSRQYKELANQAGEKVKQLKTDLVKEVEDKERLRQLRDKYCSEAYELRKKLKWVIFSITELDGILLVFGGGRHVDGYWAKLG